MANVKPSKYLGIMIFSIILTASCERTKDKMYKYVNGAFCFKRLTASEEYGCTSSRSGNTGVLHFIRNETDITWLLQRADAGPYVVVVTFEHFTRDLMLKFRNSGKVSGAILRAMNGTKINKYSPDDKCPNRQSGLKDQCDDSNPWNEAGDSLLFLNLGFPVIYIDSQESLDFMEQCFDLHNAHDLDEQSTRSLCSIELTSHMLAAVDSKTCFRRTMMFNNLLQVRYCDPLGDWSIYLPLYPRTTKEKDRSVILVTARLDGLSMFDEMVPGARSPVTGIVSLLLTAHYLSKMKKARGSHDQPDNNVMFLLLNGESFDYIGSSRLIYEMKNGSFPYKPSSSSDAKQSPPLTLRNIGLIVELDELISPSIFYHSNNIKRDMGSKFVSVLAEESRNLNLTLSKSVNRLPPASVQRFLREDNTIPGVVLSSYDSAFNNTFYHSILDTQEKIYEYASDAEMEDEKLETTIAKISLAAAKSLYELLFHEKSNAKLVPDNKLVHELLHCYLESSACSVFQTVTFNRKLPERPLSLYVGVHNNNNTITNLTGLTLAWLTGDEDNQYNQSTCRKDDNDWIYQRFWMANETNNSTGVCYVSMMNFTLALSPAFDIQGYDWSSNMYSSWTESLWQQMSARVFLKPSRNHEISTLSLGLIVLILSFLIVYFVNAKADVLFNHKILGSGSC